MRYFLYTFYTILFISFPFQSYSKIYVNIGSAKVNKSVIALTPFKSTGGSLQVGRSMDQHLKRNLQFSSYFQVLSPQAFIENPKEITSLPYPKNPNGFRWKNWKLSGADFLFFSSYRVEGAKVHADVSFYNVNSQKLIFKKRITGNTNQTKKIIDIISDQIIQKLSGKKSIFGTKIVSVRNMSGSKKEIFIMDWNGDNKKRLTYHRSITMSPAWSPKGDSVSYAAFVFNKKLKQRVNALFLMKLKTKKIQLLSGKAGANLGSDFFPNGKEMLITLTGRGHMDIFKLKISNSKTTALTRGPYGRINVEPSISPRNHRVAFSSDRSGKTMIYTMNKRGQDIKRITYAGHYNSNPSWHPYKNQIAFSGRSKGRFDIFTVNSNGTGLKRLTSLQKKNGRWANCESPSFSPDGRFIVFSSDLSGTYQLYTLNLDDLSIERITFDRYNYKSPKWSPYLEIE